MLGDPLRIEFHPTGEGHVLCRRFRKTGQEIGAVRYYPEGGRPLGLSPAQQDEFELAMQMEMEA